MYYPLNGDPVKFVAYYPYDQNATTNTLTINFNNQSDANKKEAKDFIFHIDKEEDEYSKDDNTSVELEFKHQFSKILITIINESGDSFTAENLSATLTGMPASATVNLTKLAKGQDNAITPKTTGTKVIEPHIRKIEFDHAYIDAIVPPHKGTGTGSFPGRQFKFNVGTKEYIYNLANNQEFESGKSYVYVLTLGKDILNMHDGLSNCYMVEHGTTSEPMSIQRAITIAGLPASTANADIKLETLWDDGQHISSISELTDFADGNDRKFTVTTDGNMGKGNAVIALKKDGVIYWSWHIWVINPVEVKIWTTSNGISAMDRNLGALTTTGDLSSGYAYQWGRKDPFPFKKTDATSYNILNEFSFGIEFDNKLETTAGAVRSVKYSISNPQEMFYINLKTSAGSTLHAWTPKGLPYLWNTSDNLKSVYDPCPPGYRVPYDQIFTHNDFKTMDDTGAWEPGGTTQFIWGEGYGRIWYAKSETVSPYPDHRALCAVWVISESNSASQHGNLVKGNGHGLRCIVE
jgi:hypothetical protein